jgi:hypothetical protein
MTLTQGEGGRRRERKGEEREIERERERLLQAFSSPRQSTTRQKKNNAPPPPPVSNIVTSAHQPHNSQLLRIDETNKLENPTASFPTIYKEREPLRSIFRHCISIPQSLYQPVASFNLSADHHSRSQVINRSRLPLPAIRPALTSNSSHYTSVTL